MHNVRTTKGNIFTALFVSGQLAVTADQHTSDGKELKDLSLILPDVLGVELESGGAKRNNWNVRAIINGQVRNFYVKTLD